MKHCEQTLEPLSGNEGFASLAATYSRGLLGCAPHETVMTTPATTYVTHRKHTAKPSIPPKGTTSFVQAQEAFARHRAGRVRLGNAAPRTEECKAAARGPQCVCSYNKDFLLDQRFAVAC